MVGATDEYGLDAARTGPLQGMLFGTRRLAEADGRASPAEFEGVLPVPPRMELRVHRGEPLLLSFYRHQDGERVRAVTRVQADGDRIAVVRNYFYTPELLADVCGELGLPFATNGYRYWGRGW